MALHWHCLESIYFYKESDIYMTKQNKNDIIVNRGFPILNYCGKNNAILFYSRYIYL